MRVLNLNIVAYFLNLKKNIDVLLVELAGLVSDKFFTYSNLSPWLAVNSNTPKRLPSLSHAGFPLIISSFVGHHAAVTLIIKVLHEKHHDMECCLKHPAEATMVTSLH